ncbi:MAG: hypothetical protein J1G30_02815 [Spirochaetales bacterium]|nr:hypothetical protein [Spirochaetales bacterium]
MKIVKTISILLLLPVGVFAEIAFNNSIFDYQCEVIDFSESGIQENVRSSGIVNISPMDLKEGDIFIDADGTAQKVKNVSRSGNEIIIEAIQPELVEVFQFVSIPEQISDIEFYGQEFSRANSVFTKGILEEKLSGKNVKSKSLNVSLKGQKVSVEGRFRNNKSKITTALQLPYTKLNMHGTWKVWKWTTDYYKGMAKLEYDCDLELGAGLGFTITDSKTWDILLFEGAAVDPNTVSGVKAEVYFFPSISGKISSQIEAYSRIKMDVGGQCQLDGESIFCVPTNFKTWGKSNPVNSAGMSANATLSGRVEARFGPKISVVLLGLSVASLTGAVGPYLSGDVGASVYLYKDFASSRNDKAEFSFDYGKIEIGLCANIDLGMINDVISMTIWDNDFPLYTKQYNK